MAKKTKKEPAKSILNSLTQLFGNLQQSSSSPLSSTDTQFYNLRNHIISNDRSLLSWMYVELGIIQTLVDQPVNDAFREGYIIQTAQLDEDEIKRAEKYISDKGINQQIQEALQWSRLYGGGALIIIADDKPDIEFEISSMKEGAKIEFKAVDMWELLGSTPAADGSGFVEPEFYSYYGKRIHKSRVYRINGKKPPSFMRGQMRGWGMSELEKIVRSINQYLKNQDVIFELVDEAKVDVYKIEGFSSALSTTGGTDAITARVQLANMLKNFQNSIVMDKEDEYDQKQMNFAGLAELRKQNREDIAADLKMPVTKLFGISSAGFNSGEDDIENYNAMIESEIRSKAKPIVNDIVSIVLQVLYGVVPDDLNIEFPELRMMSTEQQQQAKTNEYNRMISAYTQGLIDAKEAKESMNKSQLLPITLKADNITHEVSGVDGVVSDTSVE